LSSSFLFSSGTNIPTILHTRISLIYHQCFHNPSSWESRYTKHFSHPLMPRDLNNQSIMYVGKRNLTSSTWLNCRNVGKTRSSLGCVFWIAKQLLPSCLVRGHEKGRRPRVFPHRSREWHMYGTYDGTTTDMSTEYHVLWLQTRCRKPLHLSTNILTTHFNIIYIHPTHNKKDRQCTYNVTPRWIPVNTVVVENKKYYIF
jgi:hypothetical protein